MHQDEIRLVLADQVGGGSGPDLIAEEDVGFGKVLDVGGRDHTLAEHFAHHGVPWGSPFGEGPGDGRRIVDRDPIHLRGGQPRVVGGVVDGGDVNHLFLVDHGLDFHRRPRPGGDDRAVDDQAMFVRPDSGDERGVVGPGDGGVDGVHARRDAIADQSAKGGRGEFGVVERVGRKTIEADHDNHALRRGGLREGGRGEGEKRGKGSGEFHTGKEGVGYHFSLS